MWWRRWRTFRCSWRSVSTTACQRQIYSKQSTCTKEPTCRSFSPVYSALELRFPRVICLLSLQSNTGIPVIMVHGCRGIGRVTSCICNFVFVLVLKGKYLELSTSKFMPVVWMGECPAVHKSEMVPRLACWHLVTKCTVPDCLVVVVVVIVAVIVI